MICAPGLTPRMHWTRDVGLLQIGRHWPAPVMRSVRRFEERLAKASVKSSMKSLPLILVVVGGMVSVSCRSGKLTEHYVARPAYECGSTEFVKHTPPQFQQLKLGLTEAAVVETVGKPGHVSSLWPPGQMDKPMGTRYTYSLEEGAGVVWVDLDTDSHVTGIFWRDRD